MNTRYIRQGPAVSLQDMTNDTLKLIRRALIWGIAPTYYRGTLKEVETEMTKRKIPLKRID